MSSVVDWQAHNGAVSRLWADFAAGKNQRVPIVFVTDEARWLRLTGRSFREFYTDPRVQLHVQLEGKRWQCENLLCDQRTGYPSDAWVVAPQFWMHEPEFFGCEVVVQEDDYAWSKPLEGSKADLLAQLTDIDPHERVKSGRLWNLFAEMNSLADSMTFHDIPVRVGMPGGGTHGIFTIAARVRGIDRLCMDLMEDPEFVHRYLDLITDKTIARIRAWHDLAGTGKHLPGREGWGFADDSIAMISARAYEQFVLPRHERLFAAMTTGKRRLHLCGRAQQHYRLIYERLKIDVLDGPGVFANHGALLAKMPRLRINAQTDHTVLAHGPVQAIEQMMQALLDIKAGQPGRFQVVGFLLPETPMSHVEAAYEFGKRYGAIVEGSPL